MNAGSELLDLRAENQRLRNALLWIHHRAYVHYIGGAFDPEHMGALADTATDALNGEPVEDYAAAMAEAKVKAKEWAHLFADEGSEGKVQEARQRGVLGG